MAQLVKNPPAMRETWVQSQGLDDPLEKGKATHSSTLAWRIPFRYDLNQIPYDYTVEVRNRFKGLDLIDRVPEELSTEVCNIVQEAVMKITPKKEKYRRQNGCLRRPYK